MTTRDEWLGQLQGILESFIDDAPDETCKILAKNLWEETAELAEETSADERGCTCRWPSVNSASIEPPDGPILDRNCPVHGENPDDARDRQMDREFGR